MAAVSLPNNAILGESRLIEKARLRARQALEQENADMGVGFAEGLVKTSTGLFTSAWCVIITSDNNEYVSGGFHVLLPRTMASKFYQGYLLEEEISSLIEKRFEKPYESLVGAAFGQAPHDRKTR